MIVLLFMIKTLRKIDSQETMIKRSQEIKSEIQENMMMKKTKIAAIVAIALSVSIADVAQAAAIALAQTVAKMDAIIAVMHLVRIFGQDFTTS